MSEPAQALTNPRIDPWSRWMTMIRQRRVGSAPAVQASATQLPFRDAAFEAALAILTVHHWPDRARGLGELARVARGRIVILTWDPATSGFWLVDDYFPEIVEIDRPIFPSIEEFSRALGRVDVHTLPIPHDCVDGFLGAYWRRPHAYLDARKDRKSTRLNSSHDQISYAVFCLKKKKQLHQCCTLGPRHLVA